MYHQLQKKKKALYSAHTLHLYVLYSSQNKIKLIPCTALTYCSYKSDGVSTVENERNFYIRGLEL